MNLFHNIKNKFKATIFALFSLLFLFTISLFIVSLPLKEIEDSTIVYDRNDIEIWEIPYENRIRHRNIIHWEIPEFYRKILIYWEDRSFFYNIWISIEWLGRSVLNNFSKNNPVQWASTISAQFIRNNLWLNEERWMMKKILETYYSLILNVRFSKNEILEKYVNQIYFSNLNYWLKSASLYYFGKEPSNLTKAEILALFTIQKNSSRYDPYKKYDNWRKRYELIANNLKINSVISEKEYSDIVSEKLTFLNDHHDKLPYVEDFLISANDGKLPFIKDRNPFGSAVRTTIDYNLTKKIESIWESALYDLSWKNVKDYSVLISDRKTSEILVMIWWKNYYSNEWQVNSVLALRQPWSTIKPFNYLLADKFLWLKPTDSVLDLPVSYQTKQWYSYEPKNYSTKFEWEVSAWIALAQSMNVPAVRVLEKVWVKNLLDFLRTLWIVSLNKDADEYWLALTLWDWEVSLYELVRAYSIFPNDWKWCDFKFLKWKNSDCRQIIEKKYTDDINEVLSSRFLKIWWYPINSALDFQDMNVFFKTWTSRNFRDNWTIWYTPDYIIGVWAGNKDASNMKWVSWATWAWEIFSRIVRGLEKTWNKNRDTDFSLSSRKYLEITSPLPNQLFKINKLLPADKQKIRLSFATNLKYSESIWQHDGKNITWDLLALETWFHTLSLVLLEDWMQTWKSEVSFRVVADD